MTVEATSPTMNRAVEKLIRTLERIVALYGELLAASKEKTDFLVACNVEAIEAAQGREEMIVGKLVQMESVRDQVLADAGEAVGTNVAPPTISAVILAMGESDEGRERLFELRKQLIEVSRDLAATNRLNEQLCTQSLVHLDVYMGLVTGRSGRTALYNSQGKAHQYNARALVSKSA